MHFIIRRALGKWVDGAISFPFPFTPVCVSWQTKPCWATVPWPNYTLWLQSYRESGNAVGNYVGQCSVLIKSIKGRAGPTCRARGFQRMFFSRAGAELRVLCGRFFSVRDTTPLSARSEPTRLRNCQPTCARERTEGQRWWLSIIWIMNNTIITFIFSV